MPWYGSVIAIGGALQYVPQAARFLGVSGQARTASTARTQNGNLSTALLSLDWSMAQSIRGDHPRLSQRGLRG